jgi:hypothetical protein
MYGYFKVNENDIGDENSSSTATDQFGSGDVDDTSGGIASVQSDTGAGNTGTNQNVDGSATLLKLIQADDQMHCFLPFRKEEGGESTALLFHHMARHPSRLGENSPFSDRWYVTGGQPVGGVHVTYDVPLDLFGVTSPMQAYTVDRTQRELANDITIKTLIPEPTTENVVDIELISTRRSMWIPNIMCRGRHGPGRYLQQSPRSTSPRWRSTRMPTACRFLSCSVGWSSSYQRCNLPGVRTHPTSVGHLAYSS